MISQELIAEHEAAHAVMRWLRCMASTRIELLADGGLCGGTGRKESPDSLLLVTLAGFAWEAGCGFLKVDFDRSRCVDLDRARSILAHYEFLRVRFVHRRSGLEPLVEGPDAALERWFGYAGKMLSSHFEIVERLGETLLAERQLSARRVAAILREYGRANAVRRPVSPFMEQTDSSVLTRPGARYERTLGSRSNG